MTIAAPEGGRVKQRFYPPAPRNVMDGVSEGYYGDTQPNCCPMGVPFPRMNDKSVGLADIKTCQDFGGVGFWVSQAAVNTRRH